MQKVRINCAKTLTPPEKFFVEKSLELLSPSTLDTYRLRLHNPRTLLIELINTIQAIEKNELKPGYAAVLCEEAKKMFEQQQEMDLGPLQKGYLLDVLTKKQLNEVLYTARLILKSNPDYAQSILAKIKIEISRLNDLSPPIKFQEYDTLNRLIHYFFTDLHNFGFNRQYLQKLVTYIFGGSVQKPDFDTQIAAIAALINRPKEEFRIYIGFHLEGRAEDLLKRGSFDLQKISRKTILKISKQINSDFEDFVNQDPLLRFFYIDVKAHDYYTAGRLARGKIQKAMDWLYVGSDEDIFKLHRYCFVVGARSPEKAKFQKLTYKLDGHFKADTLSYDGFLQKYNLVDTAKVENQTLQKINSTLRYLRLGSLAHEEEHKLLNYWIAIEYLFTTGDTEESKTDKLKNYFGKIHSTSYVRRQFIDLHKSVSRMKIEGGIRQYSENTIDYLLHPETKIDIETIADKFPLLHYRFSTLLRKYSLPKSITLDINRHKMNLIWNITRIYRSRNEIVHRAATEMELIDLAGHLKYYLVFTLNALLDFLLNYPLDIDGDTKITIDDFFSLSAIEHDSIFSNGNLSAEGLLKVRNPVEYLQN